MMYKGMLCIVNTSAVDQWIWYAY